ncbi:hypothetical protein C1T17_09190 [Sphingobium sp. SCG-1]|uniref:hypothetical protein n=1 Tax=Sphingobium sp. SCG-1 TaxID=2072936 RepID=UPI000CD69FF1|nr:hypothetical protein [Sphingobium sp. SCG-1]AUW60190.1 hypothetical protein C1T17_09190 [Sphingobium sp. SCG-1]
MKIKRAVMGMLLGASLIAGSVQSAEARPRGWHGGGGHHDNWRRHRGNGFGFGDAIGVAALVGAVAIVANSMSKDRAATRSGRNDGPPDDLPEINRGDDYRLSDTDFLASEGHAIDTCANAAREEATVSGGYAEIRTIGAPQPIGGGYNIDGEVERRDSYRDAAGETRRFTCTVHGDKVTDVYLSRDLVSN